ncbi:hypothetical protein ACFQQB_07735 [Nonomuraea rubra]|uniref:hypothetical protein n=1 Tax=Nonomuraea rubra TaxID=46180 RepID=UPI00361CDFD0
MLTLLSKVAEERPLVCVIDDAQWLDRASAQTLAFVARRLVAESVAMVFAVREPGDDKTLAALPELTVHGLEPDDARALLEWAQPGPLDEQVRDRLVAETRGNPLALLELPRGLPVEELAGVSGRSGGRRSQPASRRASAAESRRSPPRPRRFCWWRRRNHSVIRCCCGARRTGWASGPRRRTRRTPTG